MKSVICSSSVAAPPAAAAARRSRASRVRRRGQFARSVETVLARRRCACRGARQCHGACRDRRPSRSRRGCRPRSGRALRARRRSDGRRRAVSPAPARSSTHTTDAPISRPVFSSCRRRRLGTRRRPAGDVEVLAADHARDARRGGQLGDRGQEAGRVAGLAREDVPERLGVEPVAGQDRDVLAVDLVVRRAAAAQVVVVHRREVVVDERVGVDELDRGGEREDARRRPGRSRGRWRARAPAGCACRPPAASSASPPRGRR